MVLREHYRIAERDLPAVYSDTVHALVIVVVVMAVTVLRALGQMDNGTVGNVYLGAVGYAAARAGSVGRRQVTVTDGVDNDERDG